MTQDVVLIELSENETRFCELYAATHNAPWAYRTVFSTVEDVTKPHHRDKAHKLLATPHVRAEVDRIQAALRDDKYFTLDDAFNYLVTITTADPDELIGLRVGACRYCYGAGHAFQWREREYLDAVTEYERQHAAGIKGARLPDVGGGFGYNHTLPPVHDCPECQGEGIERIVARDTSKLSPSAKLLYQGVKQTRNGIEIMMADKSKALENLIRMMGGFKDDKAPIGPTTNYIQQNITDPNVAARAYEDMIKKARLT